MSEEEQKLPFSRLVKYRNICIWIIPGGKKAVKILLRREQSGLLVLPYTVVFAKGDIYQSDAILFDKILGGRKADDKKKYLMVHGKTNEACLVTVVEQDIPSPDDPFVTVSLPLSQEVAMEIENLSLEIMISILGTGKKQEAASAES